jgi:membrane protease subunit HflK
MPVDEILTYGKKKIENTVKQDLQNKLDNTQSGINITFVELNDVRPPLIVQKAFDDVINAKIDKREMISQAESYRNEKIPAANGQAGRMLNEAEAYKKQVIAHSKAICQDSNGLSE